MDNSEKSEKNLSVGENETIIDPYRNHDVIKHKRFISHLGISFIDLKYVKRKFMKPPKIILRNICGQINYGTLNGLFGPRECGKTALLKSLSGRNNRGLDSNTKIFVNRDIPVRTVYLEQNVFNNILSSLTVSETLQYAFRFRDPSVSYDQRNSIIEEIMTNLNLYEIRDLYLRDCTLEESTVTQVAMCLSTSEKPNMIFMEEPFTKLDNVRIENFVNLMKKLTRIYSLAITFSTSQILDSDVLSIFDKLYVLSRGGLCVYEGSVEHMSLFLRESGVIISSKIQTPIERLMKIASKPTDVTKRVANRVLSTRNDILHFAQNYGILLEKGIEIPVSKTSISNIVDLFSRCMIHKYRYYWRSILIQYCLLVCLIRLLTQSFHEGIGLPDSCYNKTDQKVLAKLLVTSENQTEAINRLMIDKHVVVIYDKHLIDENLKFFFISTAALTIFHLLASVITMNEEIIVASNEHRNGLININDFILIKNLTDIILPFFNTFSCCLLIYWQLFPHLISSEHYYRFWLLFGSQFASVTCAQSMGLVISVLAITKKKFSIIITFLICVILVLFSGYLIPLKHLDPTLQLMTEVSFLKQCYQMTLMSIYGFDRCSRNQTQSFVLEEFGLPQSMMHFRNSSIIMSIHYLFYVSLLWIILARRVTRGITARRSTTEMNGQISDNEQIQNESGTGWDSNSIQKNFEGSI